MVKHEPSALFAGLRSLSSAASKPLNDAFAALDRGGAAEGDTGKPEDPADMLNQIALDEELQKGFAPVLLQLGFEIKSTDILDQFTNSRTVTVVLKGTELVFYAICVPKSILEEGRQANLGAISLLGHLFAKKSVLYIISRDLSAMDLVFDTMMNTWRDEKDIKTTFLPWSHITKFLGEKSDQKKLQLVKTMLKLDKLPGVTAPAPVASPTELTPDEQENVVQIISQQASVPFLFDKPQDYFNDLIATVQLPERATLTGRWKDEPKADARRLIGAAGVLTYPPGHSRAGQKPLGWVLNAVAHKQPISPQNSKALMELILKHNLITDRETMESLRAQVAAIQTEGVSV